MTCGATTVRPSACWAARPSREDAIARFESEFAFLWDEIACESDDALLPQAQDLKRRLHRLVSSVREAA